MNSNPLAKKEKRNEPAKPRRRYDIDWLRVLAVLLLIPFHTGRIFDTREIFYVKNDQLSSAITYFLGLVHPWHMPLLFLLAGAATYFALGFRSGGQYATERFKRLLIPLIFGVLVIVPPQAYYALLRDTGHAVSFPQFYGPYFQTGVADLTGYRGTLTPAHLWFILFLFVFSLLALPLFLFLKRLTGQRLIGGLAALCSQPGVIFLLAVPLFLAERLLGWPNPFYFFTFFIYGYILMADGRFGQAIDKYRTVALILGPVVYLVVPYFDLIGWPASIPAWSGPILAGYIEGFVPWCSVMALLGYGKRFLNFSNNFLKYAAEASYPFYILHQTVIVVIGYYVVQWNAGVPLKFVTIAVAATVMTTLLYDLLVKRIDVTRFLFGMKPLKRELPVLSSPRPAV